MGLFQYLTRFPLRMMCRYASTTRLQVFQNAVQITDPQRIRNVGIIAHIDAGKFYLLSKNEDCAFVFKEKQQQLNECYIMQDLFDQWVMLMMEIQQWIIWTKNVNVE